MLNQREITRLLDRFMRDTDAVAAAHKGENFPSSENARTQLIIAREVSFRQWRNAWNAAQAQLSSPASSPADRARVARGWTAAYSQLNVPQKIEEYCRVAYECAEIMASPDSSVTLK